jgi:hypothetical protein
MTGDTRLTGMGRSLVRLAFASAKYEMSPLGKTQGLYFSALHSAVATLADAAKRRHSDRSSTGASGPLRTGGESVLPEKKF